MNPNQNKRHIKKVIVLTLSLVVLAFSATYAYFTATFDSEAKTTTATAGVFNVESTLEVVNSIKNKRMVLIDKEEVDEKADYLEFSVTSKDSTVDGKFDLFLRDMQITRNLKADDFKWELLKKTGSDDTATLTSISSGTFDKSKVTEGEVITSSNGGSVDRSLVKLNEIKITGDSPIELPKNTSVTLVFRLYILNATDRNQIELTEGSFEGRLYLEAVPVSELQKTQAAVEQP